MKNIVTWLMAKFGIEPLMITGALTSAVVYLAGHFNIVLNAPSVTSVIAPLVVAVLARFHVTPVAKVKALLARKN